MRPPKRPTNQCWISLRKKVFQQPLKEANRGQEQKWPEKANFEILLWKSYVRITEMWELFKNSIWKRLQWPQKFNTFTRLGLLYFWLILDYDLCWCQIEGFETHFLYSMVKWCLDNAFTWFLMALKSINRVYPSFIWHYRYEFRTLYTFKVQTIPMDKTSMTLLEDKRSKLSLPENATYLKQIQL